MTRPRPLFTFITDDGVVRLVYDDVQALSGPIAKGLHETMQDLATRAGMIHRAEIS